MSLKSKYANFKSTSDDSFAKNDPKKLASSNRISYLSNSIKLFKPAEDKGQRIRFIPIPEVGYFTKRVQVHFNVGPDKISICCPDMQKPFSCPLCKKSKALWAEGRIEQAKNFKAAIYNLSWVIDRNAPEEGPQIWAISGKRTIESIRALMNDPDGGTISIDDLDEGRDMVFTKGKQDGSEFATINGINISGKPTPLTNDMQAAENWLEYVESNPLESILRFMSPGELEKLMYGAPAQSEEEDLEETDEPSDLDRMFDNDMKDEEEPVNKGGIAAKLAAIKKKREEAEKAANV